MAKSIQFIQQCGVGLMPAMNDSPPDLASATPPRWWVSLMPELVTGFGIVVKTMLLNFSKHCTDKFAQE
jgi:hypothetical protein